MRFANTNINNNIEEKVLINDIINKNTINTNIKDNTNSESDENDFKYNIYVYHDENKLFIYRT